MLYAGFPADGYRYAPYLTILYMMLTYMSAAMLAKMMKVKVILRDFLLSSI
jgi:hypothetical protein